MTQATITYRHDLGEGLELLGYAINPKLTCGDIEEILRNKDSPQNFDENAAMSSCEHIARLGSFDGLTMRISQEGYEVPEQLREYRRVLGDKLDAIRIKTGREVPADNPVMVATKPRIELPFDVTKTGYYDFAATSLEAKPWETLPQVYPEGKNVKALLQEWGVSEHARARYFALAYVLLTDNGETLNLSQRGKGLGIAAGIMSIFGSTPNPDDLYDPKFDFPRFIDNHIHDEIDEEFGMKRGEFKMDGIHFLNDPGSIPHAVVRIITPLSTGNLVERVFGDPEVISEHPIIYSTGARDISKVLDRFHFQPPTAYTLSLLNRGW